MAGALEQAGASLADVARTRIYVVPGVDFDDVARAHGEASARSGPATTGLVVHARPTLARRAEADAVLPESNGRPDSLEQR